ncbi:DegT/DnrJ/EryC1/StrS family aminotransferase [Aestuariivirga sp.]|uniref:DegT/DnrJ/EryC1/StrS family aminotransferase n=1 Tax=Aestuariivirga sp. TaxID=2650926 RepID=UPI00359422CF
MARTRAFTSPGPDEFTTPVCRPRLPPAARILPYLARADQARHYTNHGQLSEELARRLCDVFGVDRRRGVLASSGTAGLTGAMLAVAGRGRPEKSLCICPAFTFVATAIGAVTAGYEPYVVDIDAESWTLDPVALRNLPALKDAGVVVPVAPMGRTPDLDAWQAFQDDTGIPVVMDAAACFDTLDTAQLRRCSFPVMISLHATKTLSTAEGGLVLCGSDESAGLVTRALNFGFFESRESVGPSINGKLSEYHAAVGLADLDSWEEKRAGFLRTAASYRAAAQRHGLGNRIITDTDHANPYAHFLARDAEGADRAARALSQHHFDTRRWYSNGLQAQPFLARARRSPVPVTEDLAARLLGLPCACDLDPAKIDRIVQIIASTLAE